MRVARITHWSPDLEPLTMAVSEDSLKVPIEEVIKPKPGIFQTHEIIEAEGEDDELVGMLSAANHIPSERERNMAIMFYYNLFSQESRIVNDGGMMVQTRPSPLSVEDLMAVFAQIKIHPRFKEMNVTMMALSEDHEIVTLKSTGEIE